MGKTFKYGENVDTDVIIPARHLVTSDPMELAKHCMEDADPQFVSKMKAGDIILGGENFGCGSSREHAPIAIKAAGVGAVFFARMSDRAPAGDAISAAVSVTNSRFAAFFEHASSPSGSPLYAMLVPPVFKSGTVYSSSTGSGATARATA